ncbi:MAG: hypothetical protein P4L35_05745 [Ignavibacteriaceae bacterium]|nr:hypothetical protein [Ignavibacteriaceae bacterium]
MRKILSLILLLIADSLILAQSNGKEERIGSVTFKSTQNVYAKFENTKDIKVGDTLFIKDTGYLHPAIIVKYLSQHSIAGALIDGKELNIDNKIYAYVSPALPANTTIKESTSTPKVIGNNTPENNFNEPGGKYKPAGQNISGRFSIQSFSNISNFTNSGNYQQWRYSFVFNADSISGSPVSFSDYIIFTYKNGDLSDFKDNFPQNLKIYDLAANYKFNESSNLWFGRHLNRRVSNISSIDGFQYEQSFEQYYGGIIAGSRPDFNDMGFNFKLFEYGGYVGRTDTVNNSFMENTIALMQQTNNFKTDRRFLYFQHTDNLIPEINLFFSSEADLFKKILNIGQSTFSLTGLYASANYTPDHTISFSLSYDARKDVIYYETYKSLADSLIDHETRQGFRAGVNLHPINNLFVGLSAGYRFQPGDSKPSRNFNGIISYGSIPVIDVSPSVSYTRLISSYIDGSIWGASLSKYLLDFISISLNYNHNHYNFLFGDLKQNILSVDLSSKIWQQIFLTFSYEGTFEPQNTWGRFLLDLTTRF